jgi:hypothetical protein
MSMKVLDLTMTIVFVLIALSVLVAATHFSPQGWGRLRQVSFWALILGAALPPVLFGMWGIRRSEDPALWVAMCGIVGGASGGLAYLIGLFVPVSWTSMLSFAVGLLPWAVILSIKFIVGLSAVYRS